MSVCECLLTCKDSGAGRDALLAALHGGEVDLVLGGGEQAGQGVVGDIAVDNQAVHATCDQAAELRRHQAEHV